MAPSLDRAREAIEIARERTDDATVQEQIRYIDEVLTDIADGDTHEDPQRRAARLKELERQLVELGDHTDGDVRKRLKTARTHVDEFRQQFAQNWD